MQWRGPVKTVRQRWIELAALSDGLQLEERRRELSIHRAPDPTFAAIAYAWVSGEGFADIVDDEVPQSELLALEELDDENDTPD